MIYLKLLVSLDTFMYLYTRTIKNIQLWHKELFICLLTS
nr:MAG TPA: hypothetical protein [Bacteriophage sp.]